MLLTIRTTHRPATDLGFLLHKHPEHVHTREFPFGNARSSTRRRPRSAARRRVLLDVDPVGMVRGRGGKGGAEDQYVNDRPYVASSLLSVVLSRWFNSALGGRCERKPELAATELPLEARLAAVPCRGGEAFLRALFEPLGYTVEATRHELDESMPALGPSRLFTVTLRATRRLSELLTHLYVLIPVLDDQKHYWVGDDEVEKLLRHGEGWLDSHPSRDAIVSRYLVHQRGLVRDAIARLTAEEQPEEEAAAAQKDEQEASIERTISLQRTAAGRGVRGAEGVWRFACARSRLRRRQAPAPAAGRSPVRRDRRHGRVRPRHSICAESRLKLDRLAPKQRERIRLMHGSLMYRDSRLGGFDAASVVEVIEHLDQPRLRAFERVLFESARPATIALTTPNAEYNVKWPIAACRPVPAPGSPLRVDARASSRPGRMTSPRGSATPCTYRPVGDEDSAVGPPTQMAVFVR